MITATAFRVLTASAQCALRHGRLAGPVLLTKVAESTETARSRSTPAPGFRRRPASAAGCGSGSNDSIRAPCASVNGDPDRRPTDPNERP